MFPVTFTDTYVVDGKPHMQLQMLQQLVYAGICYVNYVHGICYAKLCRWNTTLVDVIAT